MDGWNGINVRALFSSRRCARSAFRADAIHSPATYDSPKQAPLGIHSVYRNGESASALLSSAAWSDRFSIETDERK
jgi:hypothetical protein